MLTRATILMAITTSLFAGAPAAVFGQIPELPPLDEPIEECPIWEPVFPPVNPQLGELPTCIIAEECEPEPCLEPPELDDSDIRRLLDRVDNLIDDILHSD